MTNEYSLIEFDKVAAGVATIKDKGNFIPDCSTKEGYEASKSFCQKYTVKARVSLTEAHKKTKAPFLKTCRLLDDKKTELMETLKTIERPHMLAYKTHDEDKEKARVEFDKSIMDKILSISYYKQEAIGKKSEEVKTLIEKCGEINTSEGFHHFKDRAVSEKEETLRCLNSCLVNLTIHDLAEKKLKEENEKKMENDYEVAFLLNEKFDRDAKDALEREKAEMEQKRIAEEAQIKIIAEAAAAKAKQDEIDRQEQEIKRIEAEAKSRSENEQHVTKIKNAAVKGVEIHCNVTEEVARSFIRAVENNLVPNVKIKY